MMSFPNLQYIEALVLALRILIKIGPGGEVEPAWPTLGKLQSTRQHLMFYQI